MKQMQNFLAPLLILGLMLSSMSSSFADQKEVITSYFINLVQNSSAS
jgi:AFG3 family protein